MEKMNKDNLIKAEAKILITKHLIEATEEIITQRQTIKGTRTGHHNLEVEDMAIKMLNRKMKSLRKTLVFLTNKHGERPYTDLELQYLLKH